jgi:hypothetical protein
VPDTAKNGLLRVNFSLRGFAKIINHTNLSPFTPEPMALEAFGRFLASLNLEPDDALTFASLPEFRGVDYAGYIIEKERLDPSSGTWIRLEEYRIIGSKACSYKDTRIAYGNTYRYRIRTVVKFTAANPEIVEFSLFQKDLSRLLLNSLSSNSTKNAPLIARLAPAGLRPQADANDQPFVSLTDNVTISLDAKGVPKFNYSISTPGAQALSSEALNSLQSLQSALATNQPLDDATLQSHVNSLQSYVPTRTSNRSFLSEYLVSYPNRNWQYVVVKNDDLPAWPESLQVVPSTPTKSISVFWLTPPDSQRDLSSFNVYRRNAVGDPWALVGQDIPLSAGTYVDVNVQAGAKYIYAVQTNSLHGYKGFLSTQIQAELNPNFKFEQKEKDLVWISGPGARPDEPDTIFAAFYDSDEQLIAYKNIAIAPSKQFNDVNTTIIVKVRSLDTQEKKEFLVQLHNNPTT